MFVTFVVREGFSSLVWLILHALEKVASFIFRRLKENVDEGKPRQSGALVFHVEQWLFSG